MLVYFRLKLLSLPTTPHSQTGEVKYEIPQFLKSRTTDLPIFMHLLLFFSYSQNTHWNSQFPGKASMFYMLETIYFRHLRNPPLLVISSFFFLKPIFCSYVQSMKDRNTVVFAFFCILKLVFVLPKSIPVWTYK